MSKSIGISLGNNTSVAVVDSVRGVEFAISEERLNGEKNTKKFPIKALKKCIDFIISTHRNLHHLNIGISSYETINDRTYKYIEQEHLTKYYLPKDNFYTFMERFIIGECFPEENHMTSLINFERVEHHEAHMLPAAYMSGFLLNDNTTISVTYDGFGDGVCGQIYNHDTGEILAREYTAKSIALVYQFVTGALGFKEHQHEGKITGLAAFGKPIHLKYFRNALIDYSDQIGFVDNYKTNYLQDTFHNETIRSIENNKNIHDFRELLMLKEAVYGAVEFLKGLGATREDIAATVQEYTEVLIFNWIQNTLKTNGIKHCDMTLSGGLFANVKVNYKISQMCEVGKLYVLPPMGDEGTSIGAAMKTILPDIEKLAFYKDKLYLGFESDNKLVSIDDVNKNDYYTAKWDDEVYSSSIAKLLSLGKIVCLSRGKSEFGPRALGNHSILFDASKKETNDDLNKKLNRTEFMPFAPITLDIFKDDLFYNTEGLEKSLKYMTVAVPVTQEFIDGYKAAYHIDFTARPQILSYEDNPFLYNVIEKYYDLTGKKALINTSFNLHNSPIIHNDNVALESFKKADLDALLLENMFIVRKV